MEPSDNALPAKQVGAWVGQDDEGTFLVRFYSDGRMTAERKMNATGYTGEVTLTPEPGWWTEPVKLTAVRS